MSRPYARRERASRPGEQPRARLSGRAPMFPDLPERRHDVLGMRRGVLDLPQPGLAVRSVVDDEVFPGILSADLCKIASPLRPRTQFDRHRVAFREITDRVLDWHGALLQPLASGDCAPVAGINRAKSD